MIRVEQVSKEYPTHKGVVTALDDVSLEVAAGRFLAIRGRSGSGKSTLLAVLGGLTKPTRGQVYVDGFDVAGASPAACAAFRSEKIGFVFQMFHLLPYLNIWDNVVAAATRKTGESRQRAKDLLVDFGLEDRLQHRPGQLSAGERQRAAVARALINQPKVILADEPTGNLDAKNAAAVLNLLAQFQADGGTVLLVTHDEQAAQRAEETLHMDAGRLLTEPTAA